MSLLNYVGSLSDVLNYVGMAKPTTTPASGDFVKLIFTEDGHIITHGVDYLADFGKTTNPNGGRGLVKGSNGDPLEFLRGNNTWATLSVTDLPVATNIAQAIENKKTNSTILTTQQIIDYLNDQIKAADAMRYRGIISYSDNSYTTTTATGSFAGFPVSAMVGDVYRVKTQGTYGGVQCVAGDMLICVKEYASGTNGNSATYWNVVEANINGSMSNSINGTSYQLYSVNNLNNPFNIYAPKESGTENQILLSAGDKSAPVWAYQSDIIAGDIIENAKKELLSDVSWKNNGVISVTVGGTTKETEAAYGTWGISISGQAGSVKEALSVGVGLSMDDNITNTYNGNVARTISLLAATTSNLGGVIVGKNITVNAGTISITRQNVIDALGYTPGNADGASLYHMYLGEDGATIDATDNVVNPFINLIATVGTNTKVQVSGSGKIGAIGKNGKITLALGEADTSDYGGIKVGYTTSGQNYAVQLENGNAYVNVPWKNDTYEVVNNSDNGLAPKVINSQTTSITQSYYILASSNGVDTPSWYKLPTEAFANDNTWRAIKVGGTQLKGNSTDSEFINFVGDGKTEVTGIGNNITIKSTWRDITIGGTSIGDETLNFVPSGDVYLKTDSTANEITDISFGLSWYNMDSKSYETA